MSDIMPIPKIKSKLSYISSEIVNIQPMTDLGRVYYYKPTYASYEVIHTCSKTGCNDYNPFSTWMCMRCRQGRVF